MPKSPTKKYIPLMILAAAALGYFGWSQLQPAGLPEGIAGGNGRIEATEIDVAALKMKSPRNATV